MHFIDTKVLLFFIDKINNFTLTSIARTNKNKLLFVILYFYVSKHKIKFCLTFQLNSEFVKALESIWKTNIWIKWLQIILILQSYFNFLFVNMCVCVCVFVVVECICKVRLILKLVQCARESLLFLIFHWKIWLSNVELQNICSNR